MHNCLMGLVECVPNFSEGRDREKIEEIKKAIASVESVKILDVEMDPDHNRSVLTFVCESGNAVEAMFRGIHTAGKREDEGMH